jgi:hypothetical protein
VAGGEGQGAGGGAWCFVEMRLTGTSGYATLSLGDQGKGGSARADGTDGGATRLTIGSEWVQAGGGQRGVYQSGNYGYGGSVTSSGTLTNLRIVQAVGGGVGRSGNSAGESKSVSFYNNTPEGEYIARSHTGGSAGSRGYAGGAAVLGNGGNGRSDGGVGNAAPFDWEQFGGGGAGGGYAAFVANTGGNGSYGYAAVYY